MTQFEDARRQARRYLHPLDSSGFKPACPRCCCTNYPGSWTCAECGCRLFPSLAEVDSARRQHANDD